MGSFNDKQALYYNVELPQLIDVHFQQTYEQRVNQLASFLDMFVTLETSASSDVGKLSEVAHECNSSQDVGMLIQQYKSNATLPQNVEFEEYGSKCSPTGSLVRGSSPRGGSPRASLYGGRSSPKQGKMGSLWRMSKKDVGVDVEVVWKDYSHLPPAQRKKKLRKTMNALQEQLAHVEEAKSGVEKLRMTNEKLNQQGSDFNSVIGTYEKEVYRLQGIMDRYQSELSQLVDAAACSGENREKNSPKESSRDIPSDVYYSRDTLEENHCVVSTQEPPTRNHDEKEATDSPEIVHKPGDQNNSTDSGRGVRVKSRLIQETGGRSPPDTIDFPPPPFDSLSLFPPPAPSLMDKEVSNNFEDSDPTRFSLHHEDETNIASVSDADGNEPIYDCPPDDHVTVSYSTVDKTRANPSEKSTTTSLSVTDETVEDSSKEFDTVLCRMLYDFNGTTDEELNVVAGDRLELLNHDDGSGWTRVAREEDTGIWGFVPTSYIEWI